MQPPIERSAAGYSGLVSCIQALSRLRTCGSVHEGLRDQSSRDDLDVEIVRVVAAEAPTRLAVLATNGVDVIIAVSPSVRTAKDATGSMDPVLLSSPVFGSSQQLVAELALKNQLPSLMLST